MNKKVLWSVALGVVLGGVGVASIKSYLPNVNAQEPAVSGPNLNVRTVAASTSLDLSPLKNLDQSFAALAEFVAPTVVQVRAEGQTGRDLFGNTMDNIGGVGTGVIFRSDGWIITNDHVVGGFKNVTVILADGREFKGEVRRATESDIAVIKIDAKNLTAASFADSSVVRPGQFAMAVGSPFDLDKTVTFGHISAKNRFRTIPDQRLPKGYRVYPDLIQTDAAINQGNSGGPLFNIDGEVIGINSAIASTTGGSNGIGFAIPSNFARMLAETLIEKGKVVRGALGLAPDDLKPYRAAELKLDGGAIVTNVPNDGPAAKAGIKKDDIILRIGNMQVKSQMDVRLAMYKYPPGSTVEVEVLRDGQRKTFKVVAATPEDIEKVIPTTPRVEDNDEQNPFKRFEEFFNRPRPQNEGNKTPDDEVRPLRSGPAKLGVDLSDLNDDVRKQYSIPNSVKGAVVMAVTPGSVGEMLGLEPGMVITKFGNKDINSAMDLKNAISGYKWGDKATIQFGQYGKGMQIQQTRDFKFQ